MKASEHEAVATEERWTPFDEPIDFRVSARSNGVLIISAARKHLEEVLSVILPQSWR
jgi:hypothetical protein